MIAELHIVVRRGVPIEEAKRIAAEVNQQVHQSLNAGHCVIQIDAAEAEPVVAGKWAAPLLARD